MSELLEHGNPYIDLDIMVPAVRHHAMLHRCKEWWRVLPQTATGDKLRNLIRPANHMNSTGVDRPPVLTTTGLRSESHPGGDGSITTDGTDDFWASARGITALDGVTKFTLMGWMRRFTTAGRAIINYNSLSSGVLHPSIEIHVFSDGNTYITLGDSARTFGQFTNVDVVNSLPVWTHYTLTYDGTGAANPDRLKIYTNAIPRAMTFTGTIPAATATINGGLGVGKELYPGGIFNRSSYDDVMVFDYCMNGQQVFEHYVWSVNGWPDCLARIAYGFELPIIVQSLLPRDIDRITQLGPHGVPMRLYGNFGGKPNAGISPHPVDRLTQLGPWGVPMRLYGNFGGRGEEPPGDAAGSIYKPVWRVRRR